MATTIIFGDFIEIMEKEMETAIVHKFVRAPECLAKFQLKVESSASGTTYGFIWLRNCV